MSRSLIIDDKHYTATDGQTVIEVATANDIYIPHFCWHGGLSIAGVCRFCMVEVEGRPKLEIACNLPVVDGMVVRTQSEQVKNAHKWALEFHLINHPLDCPICDQAGECGLQDYYMQVGKYPAQMTQPKVLKPKNLDVGNDLILDTERCILCSRCVRFEEEVTKTSALGIFDRGDRSIIGVYGEAKIEHNYTTNLVDICPVGAFTSKDFRFKKRVWFTEDVKTICPGCATGCSINIAHNADLNRYYRVTPRSSEVNGHWMCNFGRTMYDHLNVENRLLTSYRRDSVTGKLTKSTTTTVLTELHEQLVVAQQRVALLISSQYTNEEYRALFGYFVGDLGVTDVYLWRSKNEDTETFDGILMRGDRNANSRGLTKMLTEFKVEARVDFDSLLVGDYQLVVALTPEIFATFDRAIDDQLAELAKLPFVSLWANDRRVLDFSWTQVVSTRCFSEKRGSFTNYNDRQQSLEQPVSPISGEIKDLGEIVELLTRISTLEVACQ